MHSRCSVEVCCLRRRLIGVLIVIVVSACASLLAVPSPSALLVVICRDRFLCKPVHLEQLVEALKAAHAAIACAAART